MGKMAVKKKAPVKVEPKEVIKPVASPPPADPAPAYPPGLSYALRRELEEITKQTGRTFDLNAPISVLEAICNDANRPADSWRNRWRQ
jgi:hypothetical protein